ncbi:MULTISPECIES: hypothetical protein [Bacillus cereus group]|uniref:hypothetical protein n=1 Tax=Bacillus cereus group TaxID=86661 RepID=UPI0037CDECA9
MNIVFEGLPGAGKTSIIKELIKSKKLKNIKILLEYLPEVTGDREDISFYISNEKKKSDYFSKNKDSILLCDRYWQSSAIYCGATSNGLDINDLKTLYFMLHREHLEDNYIYVYLKVSTEVSLRRAQTPDVSNMWATPSFSERCSKLYELVFDNIENIDKNVRKKIMIDTSSNSLSTTVAIIENLIVGNE